jgi:hypothetical protein
MSWHNFQSFDSSNIRSIRYDEASQTLEITFHNGGVYEYYDVPSHVASEFESAGSKGQFLASRIKGHFRYSKV